MNIFLRSNLYSVPNRWPVTCHSGGVVTAISLVPCGNFAGPGAKFELRLQNAARSFSPLCHDSHEEDTKQRESGLSHE